MARNDTHGEQVLSSGWIWTTIGEITLPVEMVQPREQPRTRFTYLDISSIDNSVNKVVSPKTFFGEEAPSRARHLVRAADVLFSTVRPYLKNIALVPEIYDGQIASTGFSVLRAATGISPKYLFCYTLTDKFLSNIGELQRGTSYPAVRDEDLRAQSIPLPPTAEQLRIVDEIEKHFSRLEVAESLLKGIQAKCQRYRASVFKAACEGGLVPTEADLARAENRDYEPASQLLERILAERRARWEVDQWRREIEKAQQEAAKAARKDAGKPLKHGESLRVEEWEGIVESVYSKYLPKGDEWKQRYEDPAFPDTEDLPTLPEGWTWVTWEQLSERVTVGHVGPMTHEYRESGIPFLRSQNVRENRFDPEGLRYISSAFHARIAKSTLLPGDIVVVRSGNVGVTCVIPESLEEANCSDLVIIQRPIEILPEYGSYYMNSRAKKYVRTEQVGVALTHLNTRSVAALPVALPPLAEQHRIVAEIERRLSVVSVVEADIEAYISRAESLRQSMLERAFDGKLVPQDPADEPVGKLLERIRNEREKLEQEQEARQRAKMRKTREARRMTRRAKQRRTLWEVLLEAASQVTPEELFQDAGFDREKIEEIDEFFDELVMEVDRGRIKETRPNKADVFLEAVSHET